MLSMWLKIDSAVRITNEDGSTITYTIPAEKGSTIIEKEYLLKQIAHEYIAGQTEYSIPTSSQSEINEQPSYSGC